MCRILSRVSVIFCASLIALTGCQTPGGIQPSGLPLDVIVPPDTQLIVLAYDKNVNVGGLKLTNLPGNVEVLFFSDTSSYSSGSYPAPTKKDGNNAEKCTSCNLKHIKNGGSCDKKNLPTLCEAFDQSNVKSTVTEHFDIYTTFGSCTKQICPYPGWCYTISC